MTFGRSQLAFAPEVLLAVLAGIHLLAPAVLVELEPARGAG